MTNKIINICYQNVCGLRTFSNNVLVCDYGVTSLTKTWLNDNFHYWELPFANTYTCFRKNRIDGKRRGGVLVAVHTIWSRIDLTNYNSTYEFILIKLSHYNYVFHFCCAYIPLYTHVETCTAIYDLLESNNNKINNNMRILGTINLPQYNSNFFMSNPIRTKLEIELPFVAAYTWVTKLKV